MGVPGVLYLMVMGFEVDILRLRGSYRKAMEDTACARQPNERSSAPSKEKSFVLWHSTLLDLGPLVMCI